MLLDTLNMRPNAKILDLKQQRFVTGQTFGMYICMILMGLPLLVAASQPKPLSLPLSCSGFECMMFMGLPTDQMLLDKYKDRAT